MLVHQYWRIRGQKVFANLREGLGDFHDFARDIRDIIFEAGIDN
jgi:uncharacterized protein YutE (UPF0331/DUF86 family)